MKLKYLSLFIVVLLQLVSANDLCAQNSWAIAQLEEGKVAPTFKQYVGLSEKGANGVDYLRIYDATCIIRKEYYNPQKLQYGYKIADKKIYIYDYETDEERLAFDFTLSPGDRFCSYNGVEWEVDAVSDTVVNVSLMGLGEDSVKRLLKVHSLDGNYKDQWLEDFGSFTNHFMLFPMAENLSQTLWMEYDFGCYLTRNISLDPIYTYDSKDGESMRGYDYKDFYLDVAYNHEDETLRVEHVGWHYLNREYICFYRVGDDLYNAHTWHINPATDELMVRVRKDVANFQGVPAPTGDKYTIHLNAGDKPVSIDGLSKASCTEACNSVYDVYGRKQTSMSAKGIYIQQGKKVLVK